MTDPVPKGSRKTVNLQVKVMLLFLIISLLPLSIVGVFSITTTENLIVEMVMQQLENVAADKASILERWLSERKADMLVISGTQILRSMDPARIGPFLELIQKQYGVYKKHTVISSSGDLVLTFRNGMVQNDKNEPNRHELKNRLFLSDITLSSKEKESTFDIAAPIIRDNGDLAGAVYGTVGTRQIIFFILNVALGKTGECYLVDKQGTFLAHKEPRRILKETISRSEIFQNIIGSRNPRVSYLDYRGIEVFGTSRQVSGTDWHVVVEQDRDEVFESVDKLKRHLYATILLCIGSALMLTWVISYHIIRPIRTLNRSVDLLANAEFEKGIIRLERRDEIGMLYRAFENMARKLQERHTHLEKKVDLKDAALKENDIILNRIKRIAERSEKFAAIGRLSAAVAHEIRTPLTSLKLFLESIQAEIEISPEYEEDYDIAMHQVNRIEATINRFLDFSKPKEPVFADIDLGPLIENVLHIVKPMISKQECSLKVRIENSLPAIWGDKILLEEALINLFVNSLEVMPHQGSLFVEAVRDVLPANGESRPCIRIDVRDTGSGIPEERIVNIFDPFYTTKSSGTGLGLPLVLNAVRHHGGDIQVKSHPDKGTIFSLFLPTKIHQPIRETNGKNISD
ncbi:MAG: ATP-binding protein [Thermodesulfobacteriota bacterium]